MTDADIQNKYEVRMFWEGHMLVTDMDFKMIELDLKMKQHFREQDEKHELLMTALKLKLWWQL